jgi:hypothetical protein
MLATITVNTLVDQTDGSITDGTISLRDAIAKSNFLAQDVINFAPSLTSGGPAVLKLMKPLGALLIDHPLTIQGPGSNLMVIDASGNDMTPLNPDGLGSRVFTVVHNPIFSAISVSISGLTLAGGDVTGEGGGIYNEENLTVSGCAVLGNTATSFGGGVFSEKGTLSLADSTLTGNVAGLRGGGLGSHLGYLYLRNDSITFNSATAGGGIYNLANLGVIGCTIANNSVSASVPAGGTISGSVGAGIDNAAGQAVIASSTISGNALQWTYAGDVTFNTNGGAGIANAGSLSISSCTVSGNSVTLNGSDGSLSINARVGGAGVLNTGTFSAVNSTISFNTGSLCSICNGGGICDVGTATILGCTVANNEVGDDGGGIIGTIELLANSLVVNNSGSVDSNLYGAYTGSFDFIGSLTLGPLQNNGGPTFTQALPAGSPAIDAGNPGAVPGVAGIPTNDQRGAPYTRRYNGRIDIGAFEYQPTSLPALPGDYNHNNVVDAADYVLWRSTLGTSVTSYSGADGNGDGTINQNDYGVWRAHFGQTAGAGTAASVDSIANVGTATGSAIEVTAPFVVDTSTAPSASLTTPQSHISIALESFAGRSVKPHAFLRRANLVTAINRHDAILDWVETSRGRSLGAPNQDDGSAYFPSAPAEGETTECDAVFESLASDTIR